VRPRPWLMRLVPVAELPDDLLCSEVESQAGYLTAVLTYDHLESAPDWLRG
jgi:hypothetical protein